MEPIHLLLHCPYTGSSDADGYPTGDSYGDPVERHAYAIYPLSSDLDSAADYDRRVVTSRVVMVPDVSVYSPRDIVRLPGTQPEAERTYFVSEDVRDYSTGPFGFKPSINAEAFGEIVVEKVSG